MQRTTHARGLTLIEVMISLTILSLIMVGVAAAVHVSLDSYSRNDDVANATHMGRSVLDRMVRQARTAAAFDQDLLGAHSLAMYLPQPGPSGELQKVRYVLSDGRLTMESYLDETLEETHVLLGPDDGVVVEQFTIDTTSGLDWQGESCITRITVTLHLACGEQTFQVTATAYPRRNQRY